VLLALERFRLLVGLFGKLLGRLLCVLVTDLNALLVEQLVGFLGVLRRDAIAVVHNPLLIDPTVSCNGLLSVSSGGQQDRRCEQQA